MRSSSDSDNEVPLSRLKHPVMMTEEGKLTVPDKDNMAVFLPKISNSLSNTQHDKEITLAVLQQQQRKTNDTASVDSSSLEEEFFTLLKDFNPDGFMIDLNGTYDNYLDYNKACTDNNQLSPDMYVMKMTLSDSDISKGFSGSDRPSSAFAGKSLSGYDSALTTMASELSL